MARTTGAPLEKIIIAILMSMPRKRKEVFRSVTKTRKALHQTFVTTYGVKRNMYSGNVQSEVILDDLFME